MRLQTPALMDNLSKLNAGRLERRNPALLRRLKDFTGRRHDNGHQGINCLLVERGMGCYDKWDVHSSRKDFMRSDKEKVINMINSD